MNFSDIYSAIVRFDNGDTPNRSRVAYTVANLAVWTDNNSDGWAYWQKPRNAARKAMALIESTTSAANQAQEPTDATDADTMWALVPIKGFLTRQGVSHDGIVR